MKRWADLLGLALAVLLAAGVVFWGYRLLRYKRDVRAAKPYGQGARPESAGLSGEQLLQLGWMHTAAHIPATSYVNRAILKPKGTTRIGLFGCSFVEGLESASGYDLASFLEKRFRGEGTRNVEVVNFGTFAYGVHQSYLLWTYLGRRFGLDYVFFFAEDFHRERDESFIFQDEYATVHARYALSGAGIELVPLVGGDRVEAAGEYSRLLTRRRYARFDYRPPLALRVLLPPRLRRGLNPFYYAALMPFGEEVLETYARIFASLAELGGRPVIWTHSQALNDSLRARLGPPGVPLERSDVWSVMARAAPEIYSAPGGHLSPMGNDLQARELFSFISGEARARVAVLELSALDPRVRARLGGRALNQHDALAIGMGGRRLAEMAVSTGEDPPRWKLLTGLRDMKAAALLTTAPPDAALVPVPALLEDGAAVFAVLESDGERARVPLGRLRAPARVVGAIALDAGPWEGRWSAGGRWSVRIQRGGDWFREMNVLGDRPVNRVTIEAGGTALLESAARNTVPVKFRPLFGQLLHIRAVPDGYVDIETVPSRGTLDLLAGRDGAWTERFPLFSYTIRRRWLAPFSTAPALRPAAGRGKAS